MQVMIIEDDAWMADLIKQMVLKLRPQADVSCFERVDAARAAWLAAPCQLIISDWNLPGESGVSLLEEIRQQDSQVPILIITGRADRDSVLQVRRLRINAFVTKPFKVPKLLEQLAALLPEQEEQTSAPESRPLDFMTYLAELSPEQLDLPLLDDTQKLLEQHLHGEQLDLRQLISQIQHDTALSARLIAAANTPEYNSSGKPCISLYESLQLLGVSTSLNLALAPCLQRSCQLRSGVLRLYAQAHIDEAEQLYEHARELALQLKLQPWPFQSAALLQRMGELCVLHQAQNWEDLGHSLEDHQLLAALQRYSRDFADALKGNWRLPVPLLELINATHELPSSNLKRELILMRLAAVELSTAIDDPEQQRLRRLLGLPDASASTDAAPNATP